MMRLCQSHSPVLITDRRAKAKGKKQSEATASIAPSAYLRDASLFLQNLKSAASNQRAALWTQLITLAPNAVLRESVRRASVEHPGFNQDVSFVVRRVLRPLASRARRQLAEASSVSFLEPGFDRGVAQATDNLTSAIERCLAFLSPLLRDNTTEISELSYWIVAPFQDCFAMMGADRIRSAVIAQLTQRERKEFEVLFWDILNFDAPIDMGTERPNRFERERLCDRYERINS